MTRVSWTLPLPQERNRVVLVTEWCPGGDLLRLVYAMGGRLSERQVGCGTAWAAKGGRHNARKGGHGRQKGLGSNRAGTGGRQDGRGRGRQAKRREGRDGEEGLR